VLSPAEAQTTPPMRERGLVARPVHPVTGEHPIAGIAARFSRFRPARRTTAAPTLGQHNEEILGGRLGLSRDELEALRSSGVIGERPAGR